MAEKPGILKYRELGSYERNRLEVMIIEENLKYDPDFEQQIKIIAQKLNCDVRKFERVYTAWWK